MRVPFYAARIFLDEELAALEKFHGRKLSRDDIKDIARSIIHEGFDRQTDEGDRMLKAQPVQAVYEVARMVTFDELQMAKAGPAYVVKHAINSCAAELREKGVFEYSTVARCGKYIHAVIFVLSGTANETGAAQEPTPEAK